MKKGSAVIYVVFAIIIFGLIMSYIFTRTANVQIAQITRINEIKSTYSEYNAGILSQLPSIYETYYPPVESVIE